MNKNKILSTLEDVVKDNIIDLHSDGNYPVLEEEDSTLYKGSDGELIWERYGEEFEVSDLDSDELSVLFDLLVSNNIITYAEHSHLVSCLL